MGRQPTRYWRQLSTTRSAVAFSIATAATVIGVLLAWTLPSRGGEPLPAINVSPVQSVQQSVQVAGVPAAAAPQGERAQSGEPLVLIVGPDDVVDRDLTTAASRALAANPDALRGEIMPHDFARAFDGDASELRFLANIDRAPLLVLGRARTTSRMHESASESLRGDDVVLDLRVYEPHAGFATRTARLTALGVGTSEPEARAQAYARLADQIRAAVTR